MNAADALRDALARVVAARESLAYGETYEAAQLLDDLERDLASLLPTLEGAHQ